MKPCPPGVCVTCRLAGLHSCPFDGAKLPLVENEKPKVVYRGTFPLDPWLQWRKDQGHFE